MLRQIFCGVLAGAAIASFVLFMPKEAPAAQKQPEILGAMGQVAMSFDKVGPDLVRAATGTTREVVPFGGSYPAGSIVIRTPERRLYYVLPGGKALRYTVGVGREGFQWDGEAPVSRKATWPTWIPPKEMRQRQPNLPVRMEGGPRNPLGARALYIGDTLYRIHGTSEAHTIGQAVSSGCIRMLNEDVIDLYERVNVGAKVYVYQ